MARVGEDVVRRVRIVVGRGVCQFQGKATDLLGFQPRYVATLGLLMIIILVLNLELLSRLRKLATVLQRLLRLEKRLRIKRLKRRFIGNGYLFIALPEHAQSVLIQVLLLKLLQDVVSGATIRRR